MLKLKEILNRLNGEVDVDICNAEEMFTSGSSYYRGLAKDVSPELLDRQFDSMESKWYINYELKTDDLVFVIYII